MAKLIGKVQRIPKRGKKGTQGIRGTSGIAGRDGRDAPLMADILSLMPLPLDGRPGKEGRVGLQGPQGLTGTRGLDGTSVTIGEVKELVEELVEASVESLPKPKDSTPTRASHGGGGSPVKYITTITTSTYTINKNELQAGTNIFGVNFAGTCTITLPLIHDRFRDKIIVINDESGNASSNNIVIEST